MSKLKAFAVGLVGLTVSLFVLAFLLRRFAPEELKAKLRF